MLSVSANTPEPLLKYMIIAGDLRCVDTKKSPNGQTLASKCWSCHFWASGAAKTLELYVLPFAVAANCSAGAGRGQKPAARRLSWCVPSVAGVLDEGQPEGRAAGVECLPHHVHVVGSVGEPDDHPERTLAVVGLERPHALDGPQTLVDGTQLRGLRPLRERDHDGSRPLGLLDPEVHVLQGGERRGEGEDGSERHGVISFVGFPRQHEGPLLKDISVIQQKAHIDNSKIICCNSEQIMSELHAGTFDERRKQFVMEQLVSAGEASLNLRLKLLGAAQGLLHLALDADIQEMLNARRKDGYEAQRFCKIKPAGSGDDIASGRLIHIWLTDTQPHRRDLYVYFPVSAADLPAINADLTPDQYPIIGEIYLTYSVGDEDNTMQSIHDIVHVTRDGVEYYGADKVEHDSEGLMREIERLAMDPTYRQKVELGVDPDLDGLVHRAQLDMIAMTPLVQIGPTQRAA